MLKHKSATAATLAGAISVTLLAGVCLFCVPWAQGAPSHGKVTPWDAMAAAVGKVPGGKAYSATYASEGGHWIYDVIVLKGNAITEVEIDATTGKVGDTETATPEGEGQELTAELSKAIGNPVKAAPEKGEKDEKEEKGDKPGRR